MEGLLMNDFTPEAGENFYDFITRIKKQIKESNGLHAGVMFNGIQIIVNHDSNVNDLGIIYDLKRKLLQRSL
jgi:hypothetical protein